MSRGGLLVALLMVPVVVMVAARVLLVDVARVDQAERDPNFTVVGDYSSASEIVLTLGPSTIDFTGPDGTTHVEIEIATGPRTYRPAVLRGIVRVLDDARADAARRPCGALSG